MFIRSWGGDSCFCSNTLDVHDREGGRWEELSPPAKVCSVQSHRVRTLRLQRYATRIAAGSRLDNRNFFRTLAQRWRFWVSPRASNVRLGAERALLDELASTLLLEPYNLRLAATLPRIHACNLRVCREARAGECWLNGSQHVREGHLTHTQTHTCSDSAPAVIFTGWSLAPRSCANRSSASSTFFFASEAPAARRRSTTSSSRSAPSSRASTSCRRPCCSTSSPTATGRGWCSRT